MDSIIDNIKEVVKQSELNEVRRSRTSSVRERKSIKEERVVSITKEEQISDGRKSRESRKSELSSERSVSKTYSNKECYDDDSDPYSIDLSMLKNLPKSIILDAIEYAKEKRREEERKEREKEEFKRLTCIPPWAKSYGGRRLETCVSTGTQYDIPSFIKLAEEEGEESFGECEEMMSDDDDEYSSARHLRKEKMMTSRRRKGLDDEVSSDEITDSFHKKGRKGGKGEKGKGIDKYDERGTDDTTSTKTGGTDVGVQIQPITYPFGMQTGHDSLTDMQLHLSELGITLSQLNELSEEERRKFLLAANEQYLAVYRSEQLDMEGSPVGGRGRRKKRGLKDYPYGEGSMSDYLKMLQKLEEEEEEEEEEASVELVCEGELEECYPEEQEFETHKKEKIPGKDTAYLKDHFATILPKILAEIAWKRPLDPVHYLAHRLYCERSHQQIREQMLCMRASLKQERENMLLPSGEMEPIKTFGYFHRDLKVITMPNEYDQLLEEEEEEEDRQVEEEIEEQTPEINI